MRSLSPSPHSLTQGGADPREQQVEALSAPSLPDFCPRVALGKSCCAPRLGTWLEGHSWSLTLAGKQDTQNSQEHIQFSLIKA